MTSPILPQVTVLMSVYNGAAYLREAIESILAQTLRDFEFLIVDDGSTDESAAIIEDYDDQRIRLVRNDTNRGLSASLNRGLELAQGNYVARMDADDVSLLGRLECQVRFMEKHPHVDICGSWIEVFDDEKRTIWSAPVKDDEIKCGLLFSPSVYHPTVMFRKRLFDDAVLRYATDFSQAQDYELWSRLMDCCVFANIGSVLLCYRLHDQSVGRLAIDKQLASATAVRKQMLQKLGFEPTEKELALHNDLARCRIQKNREFLEQVHDWLLQIQSANRERQQFPQQALATVLARRWHEVCLLANSLGMDACRMYYQSPLAATFKMPLHHHLAFLLRAVVH